MHIFSGKQIVDLHVVRKANFVVLRLVLVRYVRSTSITSKNIFEANGGHQFVLGRSPMWSTTRQNDTP